MNMYDNLIVNHENDEEILSESEKEQMSLALGDERVNRIIYQDRVEQLKEIMNEVKDYPTVLDVMIALDEYRQEAENGYKI